MQITERQVGDVMILDLKGKITLGEGDELLKDKVNSIVSQGRRKIVLNLAEVPYLGLWAIVVTGGLSLLARLVSIRGMTPSTLV